MIIYGEIALRNEKAISVGLVLFDLLSHLFLKNNEKNVMRSAECVFSKKYFQHLITITFDYI